MGIVDKSSVRLFLFLFFLNIYIINKHLKLMAFERWKEEGACWFMLDKRDERVEAIKKIVPAATGWMEFFPGVILRAVALSICPLKRIWPSPGWQWQVGRNRPLLFVRQPPQLCRNTTSQTHTLTHEHTHTHTWLFPFTKQLLATTSCGTGPLKSLCTCMPYPCRCLVHALGKQLNSQPSVKNGKRTRLL